MAARLLCLLYEFWLSVHSASYLFSINTRWERKCRPSHPSAKYQCLGVVLLYSCLVFFFRSKILLPQNLSAAMKALGSFIRRFQHAALPSLTAVFSVTFEVADRISKIKKDHTVISKSVSWGFNIMRTENGKYHTNITLMTHRKQILATWGLL